MAPQLRLVLALLVLALLVLSLLVLRLAYLAANFTFWETRGVDVPVSGIRQQCDYLDTAAVVVGGFSKVAKHRSTVPAASLVLRSRSSLASALSFELQNRAVRK